VANIDTNRLLTDYHGGLVYKKLSVYKNSATLQS